MPNGRLQNARRPIAGREGKPKSQDMKRQPRKRGCRDMIESSMPQAL